MAVPIRKLLLCRNGGCMFYSLGCWDKQCSHLQVFHSPIVSLHSSQRYLYTLQMCMLYLCNSCKSTVQVVKDFIGWVKISPAPVFMLYSGSQWLCSPCKVVTVTSSWLMQLSYLPSMAQPGLLTWPVM